MPTILFIDDEPMLLGLVEQMLKFENYEVLTAEEGYEGLEIARRRQPDLILCDVTMPGLTGFDVQKMLRKDRATAHIPFIFVTALTDQVPLIGTPSVSKPFTFQELRRVVNQALAY